jgi:hypothetical protein
MGFGFLLVIVSSLILAVYKYEISNHQILFREILFDIYKIFIPPVDAHILLLIVVISLIGAIVFIIPYKYWRRKLHKKLISSDVEKLIKNGQNEEVEFKKSLRYDYRHVKTDKNLENIILKSISGFLNGRGGTLLIGVDDFGEVLGLDNDYWSLKKKTKDGFEQRLMLIISNAFGKAICSKIHASFHTINDKEICSLFIERSKRPIYFTENNQTVFFLRTGNVTNPLSTRETVEYLESKKHLIEY